VGEARGRNGCPDGIRVDLLPGDPVRARATRAVLGSVGVALFFWIAIQTTKEIPAIYQREPWQDDPYDALVSFMMSTVPFWTLLCALRLPLCVPSQPLSIRRAVDLVRALRVQAVLIAVTVASEWVSVALATHRDVWNGLTATLIALLTVLTVLTGGSWWFLRRSLAELRRSEVIPLQPDWITDVMELGTRIAQRLGPVRRPAMTLLRWLDDLVAAPLREHPVATTGALSLLGGIIISLPQIFLEHYAVGLAALFILISAASLFAFLVIVGAELTIVHPRAERSTPAVHALVFASLGIPLAATFRSPIWSAVGVNENDAGVGDFAVLCLGAGAGIGLLVLVADWLYQRFTPTRDPGTQPGIGSAAR
jgi:hypothetical protein